VNIEFGFTVFQPCSAQAASSAPASQSKVGTLVTVTARASVCPNPLYEFWILAPGSSSTWRQVQPYSTKATYAWATAGLAAGTYMITVWERDANSTGITGNAIGRWDTQASLMYAVTPYTCAAASLQGSPATSTTVGATVTFTATASGCPNPLYQFWILAPGASSWQLARPYSSSAAFSWTTTGKLRGSYEVAVWARDSTSTGLSGHAFGRWDAFAATYHSLS
jgi:hypothetical protein